MNKVTLREKLSYGLYNCGQNFFFTIIGFMTTYYTDIGIGAASVAVIALITKVWDAVNDPIFGAIMDKVHFKKGKFIPWLRISILAIPIATILLFTIPSNIPMPAKLLWATLSYMLWDTAYTICDVPNFGLVTTMTDDLGERKNLNFVRSLFSLIAGIAVSSIVPAFRQALGGWTSTAVTVSLIGIVTMLPICLFGKERVMDIENQNHEEEHYGIKDMLRCVRSNKYLLIFFSANIISSMLGVGSAWSIYIARYCLGGEEMASVVTLVSVAPTLIGTVLAPVLCKKHDKFKVLYGSVVLGFILNIVKFLVGYQNITLFMIASALTAFPTGMILMVGFQFTPDCYEYGRYKTGLNLRGVTFAVQTFSAKISSALATFVSTFSLTLIGFVEGEHAVQPAGIDMRLWVVSCVGSLLGNIVMLIIYRFYKLNDHDVQLMVKSNLGEISREEAEAQMINKY